jgi:hypothetical protein
MRAKSLFATFALLYLTVSGLTPAGAEEKGGSTDAPQDIQAQMDQMMAKAKEAGTPGPGHAVLKNLEGDWTVLNRMWMKPGDEPMKSEGTSSIEWVLGGRFLQQKYKGDWMGQPFDGMGIVGYDNVKKEYVSIWMDSMATGIMRGKGRYDKGSKTIKDEGTYSCPIKGGDVDYRSEWKIGGKDKNNFTMFTKDPDGKEFKMMEITYTRAK